MRIGEVAGCAGVSLQTLRYYERRGLIGVPPRTSTGHRDYPPEAARVVRFIKHARSLGFRLAEVAELLDLADRATDDPGQLRDRATAIQTEMDSKILDLAALRDGLERFADARWAASSEECGLPELYAEFCDRL